MKGSVDAYTPGGGYSEHAQYRQIVTFVIESGEYAYFVQENPDRPHLSLLPPKPANLTVNAPVRFAVEKQSLYLIDDAGKEHKTEIVKRVLKPKP